jgi:hypothetical protein
VLAGFVSFARARDVYGVVFADDHVSAALAVDPVATDQRRRELAVTEGTKA